MNLDETLKELKKEYLKDLPKIFKTMKRALSEENISLFADECHKLKGTGKTYGIADISTVAGLLEDLILQNSTPQKLLTGFNLLTKIHQAEVRGQTFNLQEQADFNLIK